MKFRIILVLAFLSMQVFAFETNVFHGGDDAGNGGFAYKQSIKILELAANDLEHKIIESDIKELVDHPERKVLMQNTLSYDHLQKLYKTNKSRKGRVLAMDYVVNPPAVKILNPYYVAFMGKTDSELDQSVLEVEKRLLHEVSHIWGYNEKDSEAFALRFLDDIKMGEKRPTNQIEIKSNFCSCLEGKSDLINDCDTFCNQMPKTSSPLLYLDTILGPDIIRNPKLGNLYNWCNVQLDGDSTSPQCFLTATDDINTIEKIGVSIHSGSNTITANISNLEYDKTYILKIIEGKTGSNAQSKDIQIRRKRNKNPNDSIRKLLTSTINQYTCIFFGGSIDSSGNMNRTSYTRKYYYFDNYQTPPPLPPLGGNNISQIICHDEQAHPGNDSAEYPRLELISGANLMWNKFDPSFFSIGTKLKIDEILEERLRNEYGIIANLKLFNLFNFPSRPSINSNSSAFEALGYIMTSFTNSVGKSFCPNNEDFGISDQPLLNLLQDYIPETEALYLAEKEAELIQEGPVYKSIYATMLVTQTELLKYSFYMENGLKIKASPESLHNKTIYFYGPTNDFQDPFEAGSRKLFTIRSPSTLNWDIPMGLPIVQTTDKSIGCIPKGKK